LGRSAIAIVEEDKRCFACTSFPHTGIASRCIVPCHYNQRCYLKATHANATRKLIIVLCFSLFKSNKSETERDNRARDNRIVSFCLKSPIVVVQTSDGYVICSSMVVSHMITNIGVCVQLIYVIPVILVLFVVSEVTIYFIKKNIIFFN
jgi:hypothetical protein